ncbi:MAG TPA: PHP domain-containing protein [bacterium]|nr:PHP domain-containing protein [bacterium]
MLIDLQLHSIYSDGYLNPTQLIKLIKKQGVKVASLTDHNTISGLEEFKKVAKKNNIKVINGLELYVKYKRKKINLLWYNFDDHNETLLQLLKEIRHRRYLLCQNILFKLKRRSYKINIPKILSEFEYYIPVNRLADKVLATKFNYNLVVKNIRKKSKEKGKLFLLPREEDILNELFFNKKYGILNESYINAERLLKIKKEVGGQIVFCHPGRYNKFSNNMTGKLKEIGLIDGIEVLSPHHSLGAVLYAQFLSEQLDLIATGGSDFHRLEEGNYLMEKSWDWFKIDSKYLRKIDKIIK